MEFFKTNDGCKIAYQDVGSKSLPVLILVRDTISSALILESHPPTCSYTVSPALPRSSNETLQLCRSSYVL